jgi:hypothetical protein
MWIMYRRYALHWSQAPVPSLGRRILQCHRELLAEGPCRYLCYLLFTLKTHSSATDTGSSGEPETPALSMTAAFMTLGVITVIVAVCSECAM